MIRLQESLAEDYPTMARILGDHGFINVVRQYLKTHPPQSYSLCHVGDRLPLFLNTPSFEVWLQDVAALERSLYQAFYAADATPWNLTALSGTSEEQMAGVIISLAPAVSLLSSSWTIYEVWVGELERPLPRAQKIVIYRTGFDVSCSIISEDQYSLLNHIKLKTSLSLGELLDLCLETRTEENFIEWISDWAAKGILQGS